MGLEAKSVRKVTHPQLPRLDALQKVGLKMRWFLYLPVEGPRDGFAAAQCVDNQFVVQTHSGMIAAVDAETGHVQWRARFDKPYGAQKEEIAHNDRMFFAVSNARVFGIERTTGNLDWSDDLPGVLVTAPTADPDRMYVCTSDGRVHAYVIPLSRADQRTLSAATSATGGLRTDRVISALRLTKPEPLWSFQLEAAVLQPPVLFGTHMVFADGKGTLFSFQRDQKALADVIRSPSRISAPMARQGDMLYVPSEDHMLYAYAMETGSLRLEWRFAAGSRVTQKPVLVGDDVLALTERGGLTALDRNTGLSRWNLPNVERFLGASKRLIAAADQQGRTIIIDRKKGTVIGTLDTREYGVLVNNDVSNRIFLANHDGLVVCLQDADPSEDEPAYHQAAPKQAAPKPAEPPAREEEKKEEMKEEEKKK